MKQLSIEEGVFIVKIYQKEECIAQTERKWTGVVLETCRHGRPVAPMMQGVSHSYYFRNEKKK